MNPQQSKMTLEDSMQRIIEIWSNNKYLVSVDSVYLPCGPDEKPENILCRNIRCTSLYNFRSYEVKFKMGTQVDYWEMYDLTRRRTRSRSLPGGLLRTVYGEWGVVYGATKGVLIVELDYETQIGVDDYEIGALFHDMKLYQMGINVCGLEIPIRCVRIKRLQR